MTKKEAFKLYQKGLEFLRNGNPVKALEYLNGSLDLFPDNPEILADKGAVLAKLGRYKEALDLIDEALKRLNSSENKNVLQNRAYILQKIKSSSKKSKKTVKISQSTNSEKYEDPQAKTEEFNHYDYITKVSKYKELIQKGNIFLGQENLDEAVSSYKIAIGILDEIILKTPFNIPERKEKFELLEFASNNESLSKLLIPPLIKQKIIFLKGKKSRIILNRNFCVYCFTNFNNIPKFCTNCGKDLKSNEAYILREFYADVYERFLNYEFLINLFDKNLENTENLLIYEKDFNNLTSYNLFPKIPNRLLIKAIIRILQVTRIIQQIHHPEVLTHNSIIKIHDAVYKSKDLMGRQLKQSWGLFKFEETSFPEKFDEIVNESRTDMNMGYKDASVDFDYEGYFFMPKWGHELESKVDFDKPKISLMAYIQLIENRITAFAKKNENGTFTYKIYLLESKPLKLVT